MTRRDLEQRLWSRVEQGSPDACWLWQGWTNDDGHGVIRVGQHRHGAHRIAYQLWVGPVPDGFDVHHLCQVPPCVNPAHLQALSHSAHLSIHKRGNRKTHCKHGHEFTPENTYIRPDGAQHCLICQRAASRRYKSRLRDSPARPKTGELAEGKVV